MLWQLETVLHSLDIFQITCCHEQYQQTFELEKKNRDFQVWTVATFQELFFLEKYFRQTENNSMTIGLNIFIWIYLWNLWTYEICISLAVMWQVENHKNPQKWHWFESQNAITFDLTFCCRRGKSWHKTSDLVHTLHWHHP